MLDWLKRRFDGNGKDPGASGVITRTCKKCGKTFTLPAEVQHWPDYCQPCRAKYQPVETVTRTCRRCGKPFSFPSSARPWPKYCTPCKNNSRSGKR